MIKRGTAFFALFLFGILFYTCVGVDDQNLGDNYYYLPKYEAKDIGYPGGAIVYKSAEKNIFKEVKIEGEVINVNSNKDFIIAIQKAYTSRFDTSRLNITEMNCLKYYIINKKSDLVYGPFNKKDYQKK